ncbi:MAG: ArsR/SmtB family transcription factor [Mesonia sp.]|tara:strand:- start:36429 stop:36758 length:330 start_codon:yes stop_codon:yes gene_type:complete
MKKINNDPFRAISDSNRREILMMISKENLSINDIAENFDISRPAVSKHIKILYTAGFILIETKGKERICGLKPDGFEEISKWIEYFEEYWNSKIKNLENLLNRNKNQKQ